MTPQLIGKSINRIDAMEKVTGKAVYPGDLNMPDQAYMKIVFAETPHAIIKKMDVSQTENYEGVIAVFTAQDVPCNEYGLIEKDQPVLCGTGSEKPFADHVRFVGDQIALVIAENEEIAEKAAKLVQVRYEKLPIVSNIEEALQENPILLHPDKNSNVFCEYHIRHGDIEAGFRDAETIIEGAYETPAQEHAFLQPEAGLGYIDEEGRVTVAAAAQWVHEDLEQIAHALKLPAEKVRVIYPAIGGAFGGREDLSIQIVLALAALKLREMGINRPVKTVWSRRDSIIGHHKRHPYRIRTKWGAKADGSLTAIRAEIITNGGAYMYTSTKVLANATLLCTGPYFVPNVEVDSKAVYTNTIPNGAFRGFGGPQACFAAEMQMNKLAEALGLDPVELRLRNTIKEGQPTSVGSALPRGIAIDSVIERCAQASGWRKINKGWTRTEQTTRDSKSKLLKGFGFAAGYKNVGFSFGAPESCWARIKIIGQTEIEKVLLFHAGADVGQGAHSVFVQFAAHSLGVPLEKVELIASDSASSGDSGSASASRMTFMAGNAILGAAKQAKEHWLNGERPAEATYVFKPPQTTPYDSLTGECFPNFAYGYVAECVEVEIDPETGKVSISKVTCADDVGKAINPLQVKGQMEGAIVQATGYSILENFIQKDGEVLTDSLATYLIPTIMDIPDETNSIIVEKPDPLGPEGARGMGEMPYLPLAPAVASAVHNATGIWFNTFPLTEERILKGIRSLKNQGG